MTSKLPYTPSLEALLDKIEEIGTIKRKISLRDQARTSGYGLYVQSGRLPGGAMQYMAGGKYLTKLVFIREVDGTRIVKKYHPGSWEVKVEVTLSLCRTLERLSKEQISWAPEKIMAYEAKEKFYYPFIAKVYRALQEHGNQLKNVWEFISTEQKKNLLTSFFQELEEEWPIESFEINIEEVYKAIRLAESVMNAYLVGYMIGKSWISEEEGGDNTLYLGDRLAVHIRSVLKGAQSKGVAFSTAFARVAAEGTMAALTSVEPDKSEHLEPLEEEKTLSPKIWNFLVDIMRKGVKEKLDIEQVTTDHSSQFKLALDKLDKLEDYLDSTRLDAWEQVYERFCQADHDSDFRQAIGWLTWLFILWNHRERITPDGDSKEHIAEVWKLLGVILRVTIDKTRKAEDWASLFLALGFYDWLGMLAQRDGILQFIYDQIGEQAVESRLLDIERNPRMMVESLLVSRLQRYLGKL